MAGRRIHNENTFSRGYINTSGIAESVRKLQALGHHVLSAAKNELKHGADMIVADAKNRCPVRTGALKSSIKAMELENGAAYEISANAKNQKGIAYGQFVEFGPYGTAFLYPAMDACRDSVNNNVKNAIQNAVRRGY